MFSSDYPGSHARLWQYFGPSLSHSVFALCFMSFLLGKSENALVVLGVAFPYASMQELRSDNLENAGRAPATIT